MAAKASGGSPANTSGGMSSKFPRPPSPKTSSRASSTPSGNASICSNAANASGGRSSKSSGGIPSGPKPSGGGPSGLKTNPSGGSKPSGGTNPSGGGSSGLKTNPSGGSKPSGGTNPSGGGSSGLNPSGGGKKPSCGGSSGLNLSGGGSSRPGTSCVPSSQIQGVSFTMNAVVENLHRQSPIPLTWLGVLLAGCAGQVAESALIPGPDPAERLVQPMPLPPAALAPQLAQDPAQAAQLHQGQPRGPGDGV